MNEHMYRNDLGGAAATTGITMTGFLLGAVVGAGLALLLAPAPGGETRRRLGETARRLGDKATEAIDHVREKETGGGSFRSTGARTPQPGTTP